MLGHTVVEFLCAFLKISNFHTIFQGKRKFIFSWMALCIVGLIFSTFLFISAIALTVFLEFYSEIIWTLLAEPINIGKDEP
jgi:hypothetical protein